jgi:hypothetical protein
MDICPSELSDASTSTSSASSVLGTPSPEPSLNAHDVIVDPEFLAAFEQFELVPEKVPQFDEQDVCPTALVLLKFSRG